MSVICFVIFAQGIRSLNEPKDDIVILFQLGPHCIGELWQANELEVRVELLCSKKYLFKKKKYLFQIWLLIFKEVREL